MLTADTITDEQIIELRDAPINGDSKAQWSRICLCNLALGRDWPEQPSWRVMAARGHCAEIINEQKQRAWTHQRQR